MSLILDVFPLHVQLTVLGTPSIALYLLVPRVSSLQVESSTQPSLAELFKKSADEWECKSCWVRNKSSATECVACSTKNPSATTRAIDKSSEAGRAKSLFHLFAIDLLMLQ